METVFIAPNHYHYLEMNLWRRILESCHRLSFSCVKTIIGNIQSCWILEENNNIPSSWAAKSLFLLSTLHFDLTLCEIVKIEAIKNCVDKSWTSFLCIQVVSSVRNRSVSSLTKSSFEIYLTVIYVKII